MIPTDPASWAHPGYGDIVSATLADDEIEVTFANGDVVALAPTRFGIMGHAFRVESVDGGQSVRVVDQSGEPRDISWSQIRALSDSSFAQELRRQDAEESRRIGRRLKALREDRNLSQRDLAKLADMSGPQLSKIESGNFDLRLSTVRTLLRALDADFADIANGDAPEVSQKALRKAAEKAGVPRDLVEKLLERTTRRSSTSVLARALNWDLEALVNGVVRTRPFEYEVAFKAVGKKQPEAPLLWLAHHIASLARSSGVVPPFEGVPNDPLEMRHQVAGEQDEITLESLLRWAWQVGISVIPMHGKGVFSAAVWAIENSPTVILKDSRDVVAYWLFDLAHELGHIALGHITCMGLVDVEPPTLRSTSDDIEAEATRFALDLLMPHHDALMREVRRRAQGNHLLFKGAVASAASQHRISPGLLGMVSAYELTEVGEYKDRWGSATNLAKPEGSGRQKTQATAAEYLSMASLDEPDSLIFEAAVFSD